jgi:hypothetical protein
VRNCIAKKLKRPAVESSPPASNTHDNGENRTPLVVVFSRPTNKNVVSIEIFLCHPIESKHNKVKLQYANDNRGPYLGKMNA